MTLGKHWNVVGLLGVVSSFFLHPESCVKATDVVQKVVGSTPADITTHLTALVGLLIVSLSRSLLAVDNSPQPPQQG